MTEEKSVVRGVYMRCLLLRGMSFNRVFVPLANEAYAYDADGNQTLVTTGTGAWQVEYNGENRPVRWTCGDKMILMTFDHQGRRRLYVEVAAGVTNKLHRFTYDDYVCIARNREVDAQHGIGSDAFVWDPTEPIATRPLMCDLSGCGALLYCHDGNKNVSEAVSLGGTIAAHYEYSSFGKVVLVTSENEDQSAAYLNPYRFSSEYADDALGLVYYNYRHYDYLNGKWCSRDISSFSFDLYLFALNRCVNGVDSLGLAFIHNDHPFGDVPPKGWNNPNWTAETSLTKNPSVNVTKVPCGGGRIRLSVKKDDMIVDTYYAAQPSGRLRQDEMEHVSCFRDYYNAYESNMDNLAAIECNCPEMVDHESEIYLIAILNAAMQCSACNGKLDAPGGPHGH